ncbi:MAG: c-type cytochrome [Verrucomicrobia bacterium]|jgi:mono/diheme cytochrome c family protein/glucose/arabinose dehydrogenase|nr:c-type cytochrome [Verrucomicrobiota bacterium]
MMQADSNVIKLLLLLSLLGAIGLQPADAQNQRRKSSAEFLSSSLLDQGDLNKDGLLASEEWESITRQWYTRMDAGESGRLSREEFLASMPPLLSGPGTISKRSRSMAPSQFLVFFLALDVDRDGVLDKAEFEAVTDHWFQDWSSEGVPKTLNESRMVTGFQKVFPKTNMSGASVISAQGPIPGLPDSSPSPVRPPLLAIESIQLVDGFEIKLAASEPMIQDPVALSFDENGNSYVVEMRSFMLDIDRTGELAPICRISLLKDTNGDGVIDESSVFLDKLVLPRAVLACNGGVLFVEDYQLYFAKDTDQDGRADLRALLDADYGRSNIEHAPNGLMRAMDNWIYNGRSPWRYRCIQGQWVRERTQIRGQWGMTQDAYGRLFYNVNNSQLLGDFTPPNYMGRNQNYRSTAGLNLFVATDQRVYTSRMNTAVNRGYLPDVLDASGRLHVFASSCSPVIYRGDQYGEDYVGNAFVCDPAANIVKRNHVSDRGMTLSARQAYEGFEFLSSIDERFRPVNLYSGPDGCLWLLDMYRGIAQYGMFMTDYLRRETLERNLDEGIHHGRLYRIVHQQKKPRVPLDMSVLSGRDLAGLLDHPDGWIRDTAQRLIVESGDLACIPDLLSVAQNSTNSVGTIHALWSVEGLLIELGNQVRRRKGDGAVFEVNSRSEFEAPALTPATWVACLAFLNHSNSNIQTAAIRVCESLSKGKQLFQAELLAELEKKLDSYARPVLFQSALTAGNLSMPQALPFMAQLASDHCEERLIREALMSGLHEWEVTFLQHILKRSDWSKSSSGRVMMLRSLAKAVAAKKGVASFGLFLDTVEAQSGELTWRAESLLSGALEELQYGGGNSVVFSHRPFVWESLTHHPSLVVRDLIEKVSIHMRWPGHSLYTSNQETEKGNKFVDRETVSSEQGKALYQQICAGCHGTDGEGLKAVAPPLKRSEWVRGSSARLIRIVLHGMQGPLHVMGKRYEPPEILTEMPPLSVLEDSQLSSILNFIRNEWEEHAGWIMPVDVEMVREMTSGREIPWSENELLEIQ